MSNPYLADQSRAITQTATDNLNRNILPTMRRSSVASGGWGNSAQGIAQGLAIGETQKGITNSLAGMFLQAYEGDQSRNLQSSLQSNQLASAERMAQMQDATTRLGLGNQFKLGLGNLDLGFLTANNNYNLGLGGLANQATGMNHSFYTQQRGQDLQQQQQAQTMALQALLAQLGLGVGVAGIGQQQFNAPGNALGQFGSFLQPFTGLNNTDSQKTPSTGGGLAGAIGGGLTATQLWQLINGQP